MVARVTSANLRTAKQKKIDLERQEAERTAEHDLLDEIAELLGETA
jgi:hypothetical protein